MPSRLNAPCRGAPEDNLVRVIVIPPARQTVFAHQAVAFDAEPVDLGLHPLQKGVCSHRTDAGSLQGLDFLPLPENLPAHMLDFIPDVVETHGKPRFAC
jgi:hypothetical protein